MNSPASPAAVAPAHPLAPRVADAFEPLPPGAVPRERIIHNGVPIEVHDPFNRIMIITPAYDFSLTTEYHDSFMACSTAPSAHFRMPDGSIEVLPIVAGRIRVPNDSHIDRARNVCTNLWYTQKQTRFALSIDADIPFTPAEIARTWFHLMSGEPFVAGLYAMKCLVHTWVANNLPGEKADPETGLVPVKHAGTGWLAYDRSVIAAMIAEWPGHVRGVLCAALEAQLGAKVAPDSEAARAIIAALETVVPGFAYEAPNDMPWRGQQHHAFYASGPIRLEDGSSSWLSEDWMLCHRWRALRGPKAVKADEKIRLQHLGRMLFPPAVNELVAAVKALRKSKHPALPKELI